MVSKNEKSENMKKNMKEVDVPVDLSYEEAYSRMEIILNNLEDGNISLDESLKLYEEGINLFRVCNKILEDAELKISEFNKDGEEVEVKFDGI